MSMPILRTIADLRAMTGQWRQQGLRIGLVPTMGALHEGHLSLVRQAKATVDRAIASIFVNPTQFGPHEDFTRYPRDEEGDAALLTETGCDALFAPDVATMYAPGFAVSIDVGPIAKRWEGAFRPGHFQGVATVVAKLLLQVAPDAAWFGEKDFQQLAVIRRLVADLDIPVAIHGACIVREADGLAMSSRNRYLTADERRIATALNSILQQAIERFCHGATAEEASGQAHAALLKAGFTAVDYVAFVDATSLEPVEGAMVQEGADLRLLAVARLGAVRLLDNFPVPPIRSSLKMGGSRIVEQFE
jgi:pantoate--beta-alanine ligase